MSSSSFQHVHRASMPPRPMHRLNRRRALPLAIRAETTATSRSPNATLGLIYGLLLSVARWAVIGLAIHVL